ncbi:MAG: biotin--[acetyl-CoA-carboxylase] ligase [Muribaculaceae bacterium]|nr:biotin--[acetyl-CoA-carboxylase] ligase [Muribaculaceae bacterium]
MNIIKLDSTDSTNNWLIQNEHSVESPALVFCISQTAGRGQRGNSWESEPGKNITASIIFHPENFPAHQQFKISEAVALTLTDYLDDKGVDAKVKWPNDIYVGDKKICGILVEHVVTGRNLSRTIAGFGLNLNQKEFLSDAPNPVSLSQITGKEYNLEEEIKEVANRLEKSLAKLNETDFHNKFLRNLYRHDGLHHKFYDRVRNENIKAKILTVAPEGILTLKTDKGETRDYAFKEVEFIINER